MIEDWSERLQTLEIYRRVMLDVYYVLGERSHIFISSGILLSYRELISEEIRVAYD